MLVLSILTRLFKFPKKWRKNSIFLTVTLGCFSYTILQNFIHAIGVHFDTLYFQMTWPPYQKYRSLSREKIIFKNFVHSCKCFYWCWRGRLFFSPTFLYGINFVLYPWMPGRPSHIMQNIFKASQSWIDASLRDSESYSR